jgi:hypothetical protein
MKRKDLPTVLSLSETYDDLCKAKEGVRYTAHDTSAIVRFQQTNDFGHDKLSYSFHIPKHILISLIDTELARVRAALTELGVQL